MNSKEQTGQQISVLTQSFVSKNYGVRNFLTMTSVTWKGEISLDLAIGLFCQCFWPVCQHPFMETLHRTVLLYRRMVWLTYSGKYINSIRETPQWPFYFIRVCCPLAVPARTSKGLTLTTFGKTLFINIKLCQVKVQGLPVAGSDCKNIFKVIHSQALIPTKSIQMNTVWFLPNRCALTLQLGYIEPSSPKESDLSKVVGSAARHLHSSPLAGRCCVVSQLQSPTKFPSLQGFHQILAAISLLCSTLCSIHFILAGA